MLICICLSQPPNLSLHLPPWQTQVYLLCLWACSVKQAFFIASVSDQPSTSNCSLWLVTQQQISEMLNIWTACSVCDLAAVTSSASFIFLPFMCPNSPHSRCSRWGSPRLPPGSLQQPQNGHCSSRLQGRAPVWWKPAHPPPGLQW